MITNRSSVVTAGALLASALALLSSLSLGGCSDRAPDPSGRGAAPSIDAPSLRPTDTPCDHGAEEYIDSSGEEIICGPTEPGEPWPEDPWPEDPWPEDPWPPEPPCASLPGGCFPEPEPEPPPPPEPPPGGEEPGFCSSYNRAFEKTETRNYAFPVDPLEIWGPLCNAAGDAAKRACQDSAFICAASAAEPTFVEFGCDDVVNGRRDCHCTKSSYCSYTSRL